MWRWPHAPGAWEHLWFSDKGSRPCHLQADTLRFVSPVQGGTSTPKGQLCTFRKASFCSRCLLIIGVTWSVSELGPSLSAPPHQSSSLLYSCSRLSRTLHTCEQKSGRLRVASRRRMAQSRISGKCGRSGSGGKGAGLGTKPIGRNHGLRLM